MNINLGFRNIEQESFFWSQYRNNEFDGAFANGKTYVAMQKAFVHLATFSNYRLSVCRQKYKVLKSTTMATFFKICPDKLIYRHNETDGYTILTNKSLVYWMHLDSYDEQDLRGLEINSAVIDQGEEISENIYLVLDSRVGRWDKAIVPDHLLLAKTPAILREEILKVPERQRRTLLEKYTTWPRNKWGAFLVNNYMDVLCNIADDEYHWTYTRYNPESMLRQPGHFYIHRKTDDDLNDARTIEQIKLRDPEWVDKYYYGKRGISKARVHDVPKMSVINPDDYKKEEFALFIETIKKRAALYRMLDHGETGVTACIWGAALNNIHIIYREYYVNSTLISANRQNITDLTPDDEEIISDYADPAIFKKTKQAEGGFYCVADEYTDTEVIQAPPIYWQPADNNEFATRNRINEFLQLSPRFSHPITRESPSPGLYFIQRTRSYPQGCDQTITQLKTQKRKLLGTDNGKSIYSEERDEDIPDHAYDLVRYYVAMHNTDKPETVKKPPKRSFAFFNKIIKQRQENSRRY